MVLWGPLGSLQGAPQTEKGEWPFLLGTHHQGSCITQEEDLAAETHAERVPISSLLVEAESGLGGHSRECSPLHAALGSFLTS